MSNTYETIKYMRDTTGMYDLRTECQLSCIDWKKNRNNSRLPYVAFDSYIISLL